MLMLEGVETSPLLKSMLVFFPSHLILGDLRGLRQIPRMNNWTEYLIDETLHTAQQYVSLA
jgi:hypothetical protein